MVPKWFSFLPTDAALLMMETQTHAHAVRQLGQRALKMKLIYSFILQPEHLSVKFVCVCFSAHKYFASVVALRASDWPPEQFNNEQLCSPTVFFVLFCFGCHCQTFSTVFHSFIFTPFLNLDWSRFIWGRWWRQWKCQQSERESRNAQAKIYVSVWLVMFLGWSSWSLSGQWSFPESQHINAWVLLLPCPLEAIYTVLYVLYAAVCIS